MAVCIWKKYKGHYKTACEHTTERMGKMWMFCPYCGNRLSVDINRKAYQAKYYRDNKEKFREYYLEHK